MKSFRKFLKESNNREIVIKEFEKVFPKEVVEADSSKCPLKVTEENMRKIFRILNKMFFEGKLKEISFVCESLQNILIYFRKNLGIFVQDKQMPTSIAFYFEYSDEDHEKESFIARENTKRIFINISECGDEMSFGFAIATLLHEMIHYYDYDFGDMPHLQYLYRFKKTLI